MKKIQQIFSKDDLVLLNDGKKIFLEEICKDVANDDSILEIGPSMDNLLERYCFSNNIIRKTCDIINRGGIDYCCSIEHLSDCCHDKFNKIVLLHVLEHVKKPWMVSKELNNVLEKNGIVYIQVPFFFHIHGPNPDCYRFTEFGIKSLFEDDFSIEYIKKYPKEEIYKPLYINIKLKKHG